MLSSPRTLLIAGALAGPLYAVVGIAQVFVREGFDPSRHALSQLSSGEAGWIQTANFLLAGLLVIAGAIGLRRTLLGSSKSTWGPVFLMIYGIGLLGAGAFDADPGNGFPPGTTSPASMTPNGVLHFAFGGIGFYAAIAACLVFALRFKREGQSTWAALSLLTGLVFLTSFISIASGPPSASAMLAFYGAVVWLWAWHTALYLKFISGFGAA